MDYLNELEGLAEDSYKAFNKKIIPTSQHTLGVRLPILRKMAKRIVHEDPMGFIESDKDNVYELIMLEGMVLSYLKKPFVDILPLTENFLDKVDNWAQVDSTVADFKSIKKDRHAVLEVVNKWLKSDKEFVVRSGLVILLAHFIEEEYLGTIFSLAQEVSHPGYYVHMGNAWLISACMAKYPEKTIEFFKKNTLDDKTHNKAIQKSRESYRVSKADKAILKGLKRL